MNPENKPRWDPGAIYRTHPLDPLPILPPYLPWLVNPHVKDEKVNSHPHPLPVPLRSRPPAPLYLRRNHSPAAAAAQQQAQAK